MLLRSSSFMLTKSYSRCGGNSFYADLHVLVFVDLGDLLLINIILLALRVVRDCYRKS